MVKLIRWLLGMCDHVWVVKDTYRLFEPGGTRPSGIEYHLQCTKCGIIKGKKLL